MTQRQTDRAPDRALEELLQTAEHILKANGFLRVDADDPLFASAKPALAALKNDRLLVCVAKKFQATGQFLNPDELNRIRDELDNLVRANQLEKNPQFRSVERIALVLVPGDITISSPTGDVKWMVVEEVDELPEEIDRVLSWS